MVLFSTLFGCKPIPSSETNSSHSLGVSASDSRFKGGLAYYGIEGVWDIQNKIEKAGYDKGILKGGDQVIFLNSKGSNCLFEFAGNYSHPEFRTYVVGIDCYEANKKLTIVDSAKSCIGQAKQRCISTEKIAKNYLECESIKASGMKPFIPDPGGQGGLCALSGDNTFYSCEKNPCQNFRD
jgi:hypothetical protein